MDRSGHDGTAATAPRLLVATSVPSTLTAFLLPYARHYRARGWRVDAVTHGGSDCRACREAFDEVHEISWTRRPADPVNLLQAPRELRRLQARERYDLVHVHDPVAAFVTRFALRRLRGRPGGPGVVYTAHGFHFHGGGAPHANLAFRAAETLASRWTDRLVVINREDLAAARSFPMPEDHVVHMPGIGVDTSRYDPAAVDDAEVERVRDELGLGGRKLLMMVAEFNPGKRHRDAVEALARSGREDVVLGLAGEGPLTDEVRARAEELGVGDRVRFLGYRNDVPALLRTSIGLILPSEREGLPRCLMEASCLERPVIATRIRGVTELVGDGESGILADVGDVDALAQAIATLAREPGTGLAMGRAGRERMRAFDLRHVLRLHDELYADVLDSRRASARNAATT